MIDIPFGTIQYHIRVLIDAEWLKRINRQIGLTKEGEKALIEAELITLGKASREVNLTKNKFKKKSNG